MWVCPECGTTDATSTTCPRDGSRMLEGGHDPLLGSEIGTYRIARVLGSGAMGRVYLGVNPETGGRVAIKVISAGGLHDPAAVERLFAEARNVSMIRDEHIVNVLDLAYLPNGWPYIVMEYVEGTPLAALMRRPGGLSDRQWVGLGMELLEALAAAHARGIVHRDLKPDNVMVTPAGHVKLLDFGLAKLRREGQTTHGLTATGAILGTPLYMSPEQALAQPADARADLYAFGIILYEGLTGRVPFPGESVFAILQQHVQALPTSPRTWRPDLPEALADIVLRTLAKNPADRPQSATELRHALLQVFPHLPEGGLPWPAAGGPSFSPPRPESFPGPAGGSVVGFGAASSAYVSQADWSMQGTRTNPSLAGESGRFAPLAGNQPGAAGTHLGWFAIGVTGTVLLAILGMAAAAAGFFVWQRSRSAPAPSSSVPSVSALAPSGVPTGSVSLASGSLSAPEPRARPSSPGSLATAPSSVPQHGPALAATPVPNQAQPASGSVISAGEPKPRVLHVSIGRATVVSGTYPNDVLNSRLQSAQSALYACYQKCLAEEADGAKGTMNMRLTISSEGQARGVGWTGGSSVPTNLGTCTNRSFAAVTFPPPASGSSVEVKFLVTYSTDP
jgi:serine/threonine protein kinase